MVDTCDSKSYALCVPVRIRSKVKLRKHFITYKKYFPTTKSMTASFLPYIFVPLIGLVFPFVALGWFFKFIDKEQIS